VRFLQSLDVLSVPTTLSRAEGLYVLEALANGVPVVQPRHGSFPELIEATGAGCSSSRRTRPTWREPWCCWRPTASTARTGQRRQGGRPQVFHAERMARETAEIYQRYLK